MNLIEFHSSIFDKDRVMFVECKNRLDGKFSIILVLKALNDTEWHFDNEEERNYFMN